MATTVEDAYVNHIPVMTGGNGGCASDPRLLDQQMDIGGHRLRAGEIGIRSMVQFAAIVLGPWLTGKRDCSAIYEISADNSHVRAQKSGTEERRIVVQPRSRVGNPSITGPNWFDLSAGF